MKGFNNAKHKGYFDDSHYRLDGGIRGKPRGCSEKHCGRITPKWEN